MNINFDLLSKIKYLISVGKNIKEISYILNLDYHYIEYLLGKVKTDIIFSSISDEFYLVSIIDKLLNKNNKERNSFPYMYQYKILDMLNLSDEEIIKRLNINMPRLLSFLRSMYFMLYTYDIDGVDKSYLPIIKAKIDNINKVYREHRYTYSIHDYEGSVDVLFPDGSTQSRNIVYGKSFDFSDGDIKFICIADPHFGAYYENVDYIKMVYDYASKHGIKYIVVLGDLIEGNCFSYDRCLPQYKSIDSQVNHVFQDYCYDSNIKNIILLGNHDFSAYTKEGIDISKKLSVRDDFSIVGFKEAYLKVRDEYITLKHEVSKIVSCINNPCTSLNLIGHSHQYRITYNDDSVTMKVPTLSDIYAGIGYIINKGFVVCELNFDSYGLCNIETEFVRFDKDETVKFQRTIK